MSETNMNRRTLFKLAALFAAFMATGRSFSMDQSPRAGATDAGVSGAKPKETSSGLQNEWAIGGTSNFKAIFGNPQMRSAFLLFLKNVYHLFPEDRFHSLINEISQAAGSDRDIYMQVQARIPQIKPILSEVRYALPALSKQKDEMTAQTLELLGNSRKINGCMEIGTTGRYLGRLKSETEMKGDLVLLHTDAPSYSPTDIAERGGLRKIGRFVSLKDYAPISSAEIEDKSLDLVTNFIGFHHSPLAKLDSFVGSLHRILRPGGRMIVRDHDVHSPEMNRMVALAHDVFNMGLGTDWPVNQQEIRNFTSLSQLTAHLEGRGFKSDSRKLFQAGDPTKNALIVFTRV